MGNTQSARKVNYEDIQYVIKNAESHILINTLNLANNYRKHFSFTYYIA